MTNRPLLVAFALLASPLLTFAQTPAAPADTSAAPAAPAAPLAPVATTPAAPAPAAPTDTVVPASDRPATYTIAQGDSLWTIAHKYSTTVVTLRKLNNLKKGALLHPGQVIKLPPAKPDAAAK
jgi:LysM repeat protein